MKSIDSRHTFSSSLGRRLGEQVAGTYQFILTQLSHAKIITAIVNGMARVLYSTGIKFIQSCQ
jgi:hypothetical protein